MLLEEKNRQILLFASSYEKEILCENLAVLEHNSFICMGTKPCELRHSHVMATAARRHVLGMKHRSGSSHAGSALSIVDILAVLYFRVLAVQPGDPTNPDRDRFILSKGHASAALYATLALRGFFPESRLDGFFRNNGALPGHVDMTAAPGIEASSGSLGHGLSLGIGMAIALRKDAPHRRVFVLCGNGEMDEGSVWEAIMFASRFRLGNLVLVVDHNRLQGYATEGEAYLQPLVERIRSFGWDAVEANGHDHEALEHELLRRSDRPLAIVANTIKGKGVSFMEDQFVWHYRSPNAEQYAAAIKELE
jgi:transketolase